MQVAGICRAKAHVPMSRMGTLRMGEGAWCLHNPCGAGPLRPVRLRFSISDRIVLVSIGHLVISYSLYHVIGFILNGQLSPRALDLIAPCLREVWPRMLWNPDGHHSNALIPPMLLNHTAMAPQLRPEPQCSQTGLPLPTPQMVRCRLRSR